MGAGVIHASKDPVRASWGYLSAAHNSLRQSLALLDRKAPKHPARRKIIKLIAEAEKVMALYGEDGGDR